MISRWRRRTPFAANSGFNTLELASPYIKGINLSTSRAGLIDRETQWNR